MPKGDNRSLARCQLLGKAEIVWRFERALLKVISEESRRADLVQKRVTGLQSCANADSSGWKEGVSLKVEFK